MKNLKKNWDTQKGTFQAQKALQKIRYTVLRQIRALFVILRVLNKTQVTSNIMSKVQIYRAGTNGNKIKIESESELAILIGWERRS